MSAWLRTHTGDEARGPGFLPEEGEMKVSVYLRRVAVNNTRPTLILIVLYAAVSLWLSYLHLPPVSIWVVLLIGLSCGWTLGLWSMAWIARIAEDCPEALDDVDL
jgi:Flp pilus assembly protein TadB